MGKKQWFGCFRKIKPVFYLTLCHQYCVKDKNLICEERQRKRKRSHLSVSIFQGEESVVIGLAPPPEILGNPHSQATSTNPDNNEVEGDPKSGNTCNALSGKWPTLKLFSHFFFFFCKGKQYNQE